MLQNDLPTPQWQLSERARKLTSSAIRELLKITERPEVISFAGGLPSPAAFPVEEIRTAADRILRDSPTAALQYSATEGYMPLREWVAARHSTPGAPIDPSQVLITTGSQQALELLGKVLIDTGSRVLVETPTYLGALQSFSLYEPEFVSLPTDDHGLVPEALTATLTQGARLLYAQPNFQNPTGRRLPLERRQALAALAMRSSFPVIEDDPYGALCYRGEPLPTLLSMAPQHVVHLGSFSKILAPGLRVGYIIAPAGLHFKLVQAKQATDLHTPSLNQQIVHEVVRNGFLDNHIPKVRSMYRAQCDAMLAALERDMPKSVTWNQPEGGMFIWLQLPPGIDSTELLAAALKENVAFVPGGPFYATPASAADSSRTLRLSFVTVPAEKIAVGIERLGKLLAARL
jgi:2-aminoadipate transaminase